VSAALDDLRLEMLMYIDTYTEILSLLQACSLDTAVILEKVVLGEISPCYDSLAG
jgi:hypothetical protein